MKRFLLLLLALACVLSMVACDDKKESSSKKDDDDEDESVEITVSDDADSDVTEASSEESVPAPEISVEDADAAIKAFFDALVQLDATGLKDACHDSEIFYSESFLEFEKICSGDFGEMLGDDAAMFAGHEEKLGEMVQAIIDNMANSISYELSEGRQTGDDTFTFDTNLIMFDSQTAKYCVRTAVGQRHDTGEAYGAGNRVDEQRNHYRILYRGRIVCGSDPRNFGYCHRGDSKREAPHQDHFRQTHRKRKERRIARGSGSQGYPRYLFIT
jgi:hypothetical protein